MRLKAIIGTRGSLTAAVVATVGASLWLSACGNVGSEPDGIETERSAIMIGASPGHRLDYFQIASEGQTFRYPGSPYLAYGSGGRWRFKYGTGVSTACTNASFGGDPAPGDAKNCFISNYFSNADEGQPGMVYSGPHSVAYGNYGVFNFAVVSGAYTCNQATFGSLPTPGAKKCYVGLASYDAGATEGGTLTGLSNTPIAYGAHGLFLYKVASGSFPCTNEAFGGNPAMGVTKSCYKFHYPFEHDENEGGLRGTYFFGSGLNDHYLIGNSYADTCRMAVFGGDPHPGFPKHCYFINP